MSDPMTAARVALLFTIIAATPARAGQPLVTDDASIVAPKTCQVEAWVHSSDDDHDYVAQPACNFTGNLELSIGLARSRPDAGDASSTVQFQAKSLFPKTDPAWSFGVAAGLARDTGAPRGTSTFQTFYARGLASWYPRKDLEVDLNLGAANVYGSGTFALAGAAVQYAVVTNLQLLAEVYRDEPGRGKYQVGTRYIVIPNRFEAYLSYGNLFGGPSNQWSTVVGIRLQSPAFLP
jgi:hypothetical protein